MVEWVNWKAVEWVNGEAPLICSLKISFGQTQNLISSVERIVSKKLLTTNELKKNEVLTFNTNLSKVRRKPPWIKRDTEEERVTCAVLKWSLFSASWGVSHNEEETEERVLLLGTLKSGQSLLFFDALTSSFYHFYSSRQITFHPLSAVKSHYPQLRYNQTFITSDLF